MKNIIVRNNRKMLLVMAVLFSALLGGTYPAWAHDNNQNDYRDQNGNYHHYGYHHHHRGYWNQNNSGVRLWINVG